MRGSIIFAPSSSLLSACLCVYACVHSVVSMFCDPMDYRPPGSPFLGFPRQEYWSGLPFHLPRDFPHPRIEPKSPALQLDSLPLSYGGSPLCLQTSPHFQGSTGYWRLAGCLDIMTWPTANGRARRVKPVLSSSFQCPSPRLLY